MPRRWPVTVACCGMRSSLKAVWRSIPRETRSCRLPDRYWGSRLGEGRATGARVGTDRGADGPVYGNPTVAAEGYVGIDVHRGARVAALAHGGQVIVAASTAALLENEPLRDLVANRSEFDVEDTLIARSLWHEAGCGRSRCASDS
jgi:class 3 adenylate cyclase